MRRILNGRGIGRWRSSYDGPWHTMCSVSYGHRVQISEYVLHTTLPNISLVILCWELGTGTLTKTHILDFLHPVPHCTQKTIMTLESSLTLDIKL